MFLWPDENMLKRQVIPKGWCLLVMALLEIGDQQIIMGSNPMVCRWNFVRLLLIISLTLKFMLTIGQVGFFVVFFKRKKKKSFFKTCFAMKKIELENFYGCSLTNKTVSAFAWRVPKLTSITSVELGSSPTQCDTKTICFWCCNS
jgi:hypothetical protein